MPGALGIIGWIIIGGLAGWIAGKIMDRSSGIIGNIVLGIIGGLIGGWILSLFGVDTKGGGVFFTFLTAIFGSVVLIGAVRMITGRNARTGV